MDMDKESLVVGVLALDIKLADRDANLNLVSDYVDRFGYKLDVLVLPELFTTAFSRDIDFLKGLAEDDNGPTMVKLREWSRRYDIAICGSYIAKIGDGYFNRGFIVVPDGNDLFYNKHHLFCLSAESRLFSAGSDLPGVVLFKGWRLAVTVCYDLRFPAWCRRKNDGCDYDVLFVVANWPLSRAYAWKHLLIARAIENQSYVIGCNRSGSDDFGEYGDMNMILDCCGKENNCEIDGCLRVSELSFDSLSEMRRHWPFFKDADVFGML